MVPSSSKTPYPLSELQPMTSIAPEYAFQPAEQNFNLPCTICNAKGRFAFAGIKGKICLVKAPLTPSGTISSALAAIDVIIFQHEFLTIFRYSHSEAVHPSDFHLLEYIDQRFTRCDGENCRAFLDKNAVERLQKLAKR